LKISVRWVLVVGAILLMLYGTNFLYALNKADSGGTFGDTFGAVNALFSGSALFFLVLAFLSQREELNLVREERDDTRKLLQGQEDLGAQQKRALDRQLFEQSFFSLLTLINEEKSRLLRSDQAVNGGISDLERVSDASRQLLTNSAIGSDFEPKKQLILDLLADRAYNLVSLMSSAIALLDSVESDSVDKSHYQSMLQGITDYHTAVCFAWFHGASRGENKSLNRAYNALSVHSTISSVLRDSVNILIPAK